MQDNITCSRINSSRPASYLCVCASVGGDFQWV